MKNRENYHTVTNRAGSTFLVRVIKKGQKYGRTHSMTHSRKDPLIEFYDTDHNHNQDEAGIWLGQFISRYSLGTLNRPNRPPSGLNLHGDVPKWWLDRAALKSALSFAQNKITA